MAAPKGNKFAEGLTTNGRPPLYESPEEMQSKIEAYFESLIVQTIEDDECSIYVKNATITGLCLFLGFESRQSFYDYETKDDFAYIIKRARMVIENNYEEGLNDKNCTGAIFALKNMGWKDKTETDHTIHTAEPITGIVIKRKDDSKS